MSHTDSVECSFIEVPGDQGYEKAIKIQGVSKPYTTYRVDTYLHFHRTSTSSIHQRKFVLLQTWCPTLDCSHTCCNTKLAYACYVVLCVKYF